MQTLLLVLLNYWCVNIDDIIEASSDDIIIVVIDWVLDSDWYWVTL